MAECVKEQMRSGCVDTLKGKSFQYVCLMYHSNYKQHPDLDFEQVQHELSYLAKQRDAYTNVVWLSLVLHTKIKPLILAQKGTELVKRNKVKSAVSAQKAAR